MSSLDDLLLVEPMLDDYPTDATPGWAVVKEGHHYVVNSRFGQLEVGMVPGMPWDQWLFHENGGGGSLVIGYARILEDFTSSRIIEGIGIMMLKANRFNLVGDQDDWELPGGFLEDGETKLAAGIRETFEETDQLALPAPVNGRLYAANRAFNMLDGEDEGTSVFAFELSDQQVTAIEESDKLTLMPWQEAIRITRDALSGMAIARLVADLSV